MSRLRNRMALETAMHSRELVHTLVRSALVEHSRVQVAGRLARNNHACSEANDATGLDEACSKLVLAHSRQLAGKLEQGDNRSVLELGHNRQVLAVGKLAHKQVGRWTSLGKTTRRLQFPVHTSR